MNNRLLLVDVDVGTRRQLGALLSQQGCQTVEAGDGLSALWMVERNARESRPFDLVLIDTVLPDIEGLKVLKILKSRYPKLPVIMTSEPGAMVEIDRASDMGAAAVFTKPINSEDLLSGLKGLGLVQLGTGGTSAASGTPAAGFAFLKVDRGEDPLAVYENLRAQEMVVYCDPVKGPGTDLVLLVHGDSHAELKVQTGELLDGLAGVDSWTYLDVEPPHLDDEIKAYIMDYERVHSGDEAFFRVPGGAISYLILDVDPQKMGSLYARLYFIDELVLIDSAMSGRQLVLILQADDFGRIRKVVNDRIRHLDGVIRVNELKVVPFDGK